MAKLFAEAGKVKNVLSANVAIYAQVIKLSSDADYCISKFCKIFQVENLLENIDTKIEVTRDLFLEINKDFFDRVVAPIEQALLTSAITLDEISEIILMGGGTRVPK